jgi:hypothetical protein
MNGKTSLIYAAGIIVAACIAMLCSACSHRHESPAPGFCLATNRFGEWSCAYTNSEYVLRPSGFGRNGRQAAIDWTWKQYEHDQNVQARLSGWYQTE